MKFRSPKSEIRSLICRILLLISVLGPTLVAHSQDADDALKLLPPYGQLPPTFWEQHGTAVVLAGLAVIVVAALIIRLCLQPKPPVIVPPEVQARQALTALMARPENGDLLSSVSQILRRYVIAAFELPPGEPTTAEFRRALFDDEKIGSELSAVVVTFMRECDERKFSQENSLEPMGAVNRAQELIDLCEARREQLRNAAKAQGKPESPSIA
jgi:hypothetical protein